MSSAVALLRRSVSAAPLLLTMSAVLLAAAPWLRAFPASGAGVPILGAAVLSVLMPMLAAQLPVIIGRVERRSSLWTVLLDALTLVGYCLVVVLHQPAGFRDLVAGLARGPSQILTFALPLVEPRTLMVAPVVLTWVVGAVAGECLARRWSTVLPAFVVLGGYGMAYAATERAATAWSPSREVLVAGGLLAVLCLLRGVQAWLRQDGEAEPKSTDGVVPLRSLVVAVVVSGVIAGVAAIGVRTAAFPGSPVVAERRPSQDLTAPVSPLSFVAGLRTPPPPGTDRAAGTAQALFTVRVDKPTSGYFSLANLDSYDGAGWTFTRSFRPSGGQLPAEPDGAIDRGTAVRQDYRLEKGALLRGSWLPTLYRPRSVAGVSIAVDESSGMVVPTQPLRPGLTYSVQSTVPARSFDQLHGADGTADTATAAIDVQFPPQLAPLLQRVVKGFEIRTGVSADRPLVFLQALARQLRSGWALSAATAGTGTSPTPSFSASSAPAGDTAGGTGFSDVIGSLLGSGRAGTPEQFATLTALIARSLGVPARIATGFRVPGRRSAERIIAGAHQVTTADAWTWVEVPVAGAGWVVLDSSPGSYRDDRPPNEPARRSAAATPTAVPTARAVISQGSAGHAVAPPSSTGHRAEPSTSAWTLVTTLAGALLIAALLALPLRKSVRRARRRRLRDPRRRIVAAWQEGIDTLVEAGLPDATTLTTKEVVGQASARFGEPAAGRASTLGAVADVAVYTTTITIDAPAADDAWREVDLLRGEIRQRLTRWQRVRALLRYSR